jgi:hypothetical protein
MPDGITAPSVLPREFLGKARAFRHRVEAEDAAYTIAVRVLTAPIIARLRKFPRRGMRPFVLPAFIEGWRYMDQRNYRTDLTARLERTRASITERRIASGRVRLRDWGEDDSEPGVGVDLVEVSIDGNKLSLSQRPLCLFSLHAIGRRLQRARDTDDAAILHDLDLAARVDLAGLDPGGFKIATDEDGGGWRGRMVMLRTADTIDPRPTLLIRTWTAS